MSTNTIEKFQFQNVHSAEDGGLVINAEVRVVVIDGEPWWVAKDVCGVLGIANVSDALYGLDKDERNTIAIAEGNRGNPNVGIINESGLYSLILRSRKPEAKAFKKWVTSVVLPTIRKTGAYIDPTQELFQKIADGDTDAVMQGLQMSIQIAQEARAKVLELRPRAVAAEASELAHGGQALWDLREPIKLRLGLNSVNDAMQAARWTGVYYKIGHEHYVCQDWQDIVFTSESQAGTANGTVRVEDGKQEEFISRLEKAFATKKFG